jgi:ABC-type transporter Mla subunit MlaD
MRNILTCILLLGLIGCSDSEYYKVQFENVDRLSEGDKVLINGLEVGEVKHLELDSDKKILATLWVGRSIKLTKGSTFAIHSELLGGRHIEIGLADDNEPMDTEEIHLGYVQPPDTTGLRHLSKAERDSLAAHDPVYKLVDTLITILRKSKDSIEVER